MATFEYPHVAASDPEVLSLIRAEEQRQHSAIELIASENYASLAVQEAAANVFSNKYSEGLPGKRYYGGQRNVDPMESLAIARACELFGAEHANVQPYSGSVANIAALFCLCNPGDTVLSLRLDQGGHLSHGMPLNYSGKLYEIAHYSLHRETLRIDMDDYERVARTVRPTLVIAGFSAYPREIEWERFVSVAHDVGAKVLADISHIAGLIAGGALVNPVPMVDMVMTTTHKTLRGPRGALLMCKKEHAADLDRSVFPGIQGGPHENVIAAKAVAFHEAMQPEFRAYAAAVVANAHALAEGLQGRGLTLTTGGTDNHLMLVDLRNRGIRGKAAQNALEAAGVVCNRNAVPFDEAPPLNPSGIRLGTAGVTTRGMGVAEMEQIANLIDRALEHRKEPGELERLRSEAAALAERFPPPV